MRPASATAGRKLRRLGPMTDPPHGAPSASLSRIPPVSPSGSSVVSILRLSTGRAGRVRRGKAQGSRSLGDRIRSAPSRPSQRDETSWGNESGKLAQEPVGNQTHDPSSFLGPRNSPNAGRLHADSSPAGNWSFGGGDLLRPRRLSGKVVPGGIQSICSLVRSRSLEVSGGGAS